MKRLQLLVLVSGLLLSSWCFGQETPYIEGDLIIMLQEGAEPDKILDNYSTLNGTNTQLTYAKLLSELSNVHLFQFDHQAIDDTQLLEEIRKSSLVRAAQFNHILENRAVPNDPGYSSQWHHHDSSDNDIDSDLAWDITTGGQTINGDDIVVCVVEFNGSNYNHTDLISNHWTNTAEIDGNGIDDDGNGYIDDINGWNVGTGNDVIGSDSHGTSVSGMIGARGNNNSGGAGVNWNVKIMQVDAFSTAESSVIAAYAYPHSLRNMWNTSNGTNGAFVVATNSSWGIDNANPASYPVWCAYYDDLGASGILNCGATTNNNVNIDVVGDMPTGCSSPYLISVTATNSSDVRTSSGYGTTGVDLAAPGTSVYLPTGSNTYSFVTGTSFATPCVAGAIGLLYSAPSATLANMALYDPQGAADMVRDAILNGVDAVPNLATEVATGGRLNVNNSLNIILANDCAQWYLPNTVGGGPAIFTCTPPAGYYLADQDCVQSVVDDDPFCVDSNWDSVCQDAYDCCVNSQWYLPVDYNASSSEPAVYDCTAPPGYVLAASQECVQQAVDNDPFCEIIDWDFTCQDGYDCCVNSQWYLPIDYTASGSEPAYYGCFAPTGYELAANQECVQQIVDNDPYCVNTDWDSLCQNDYDCCANSQWYLPIDYTASGSEPAVYDCSAPPGYELATNQECVQQIVDNDPYCVNTDWDSLCQNDYDCCANSQWYLPIDYNASSSEPAVYDCTAPPGYVLAASQECVQQAVDNDPFCEIIDWDFTCQDGYDCCVNSQWYLPIDYTASTSEPAYYGCFAPTGYELAANQECVQQIVDNDPYCVNTDWDSVCQADYECCQSPPWYLPVFPNNGPAIATCNPPADYVLAANQECVQQIADNDPFCVETSWDEICQATYDCCVSPPWYIPEIPGTGPAIATCDPPAGYILADQACAQQVIDNDPFCVDSTWDSVCQDAYDCCLSPPWYIPETPGAGPAIATCDPPAGYILADQACAQQVIDNDPFCVDTTWDEVCQTAYECCLGAPTGCTDPAACNYDPAAICDDLSCTYDCGCPGDFDGNGVRNAADLLIFLSDFGCTSGCTADLDSDGMVTAADLLIFLTGFGVPCD